ncbi:hypothetical protein AB4037_23255 [Labrys sp. KB_33_2]|uniref:hypothetical protein n=1 Tax=Labrys sp. KB_33_2 TaxID=3237479 RepID=UPI003F936AE3
MIDREARTLVDRYGEAMFSRGSLHEYTAQERDICDKRVKAAKVALLDLIDALALTSAGGGAVPVAWKWRVNTPKYTGAWFLSETRHGAAVYEEIPLYAAPHPPSQDGAREVDAALFIEEGALERLVKSASGAGLYDVARERRGDAARKCTIPLYNTPPAPDEAVEAELNLDDYHSAPSGIGPLAYTWKDKPHRLLYDLIKALRLQRSRRDVGGGV